MAKILVVDDEKSYRVVLSRLLSRAGYQVATAGEPESAMLLLRDEPVDLVLSDLQMPGLDGLAFCRQVQRDIAQIPFILFTACAPTDRRRQAPTAGIYGWLDKPCDNRAVLAMVAAALPAAPPPSPGPPCLESETS